MGWAEALSGLGAGLSGNGAQWQIAQSEHMKASRTWTSSARKPCHGFAGREPPDCQAISAALRSCCKTGWSISPNWAATRRIPPT